MHFTTKFLFTCLLYLVESSHFRGGTISWKPTKNNQIEINYRIAYRASYGYWCDANTVRNGILQYSDETIQCIEGCSDNSKMNFYCTDFSATEDWTSGANSVKFNLPSSSNNLYTFGVSSCCWISLAEGGSDWRMRTTANLTARQDTGKINSSPISAMQPVVRFSYGCDYTLKIPVFDDDGDIVKCRWSTRTLNDECGGVCETLSGSYLNESSCVLSYNATESTGWYAVALQIEDFQMSSDTAPFSSVSLQFLIYVASLNAPCASRPVVITDGSLHYISVNKIFNESIIARSGAEKLR
ncbi:unnamed protein product [Mytilus edulis]|uniref:Uncharacterized protein n=1 Tax=Mytilus edulis TaxID=6550 RepID=A0A8S3SIG4_MYTED|nr:unnamed protein product [Mytilus edulis]